MMVSHENTAHFDQFFYPKSVAVIGVSADENAFGTMYLRALLKFGYKGKIYPVNPRLDSLFGLRVYPGLDDIQDRIDLAVVSVPARIVSDVLESCPA